MKRDIPDFLIEQLHLDELDPRIKAELMQDFSVVERLENLQASDAEILQAYPPAEMGRRIEARLRAVMEAEGRSSGARVASGDGRMRPVAGLRRRLVAVVHWKGFYPVLAAAAVLALVVGFLPLVGRAGVRPEGESGVHIKGAGPVLHVYRETPEGAERLANGTGASTHDLLQLSYISAGAPYGMIFSIDGSGTVTLHFPQTGRDAAALESGGEVVLPYSYELDNAPRFERFYFVTADKDFPLDEILNIARNAVRRGNLSSVAFPPEFRVAVFTVNKETKP